MTDIILHKDRETGAWYATRDDKLELATPKFYRPDDIAAYVHKRFPHDRLGVIAIDVGPYTATRSEGNVLWLKRWKARWPYMGRCQ
jgi:hypothetical protein